MTDVNMFDEDKPQNKQMGGPITCTLTFSHTSLFKKCNHRSSRAVL